MKKPSQKQIVLKELRETGYISRNWCLQRFITRLGAIICVLKKEGMDIEAKWQEGDYVYILKDKPQIKEYYVNGQKVSQKITW